MSKKSDWMITLNILREFESKLRKIKFKKRRKDSNKLRPKAR